MAKVNYGPAAAPMHQRVAPSVRDGFGPGLSIGVSQRSAELATAGLTYARRK